MTKTSDSLITLKNLSSEFINAEKSSLKRKRKKESKQYKRISFLRNLQLPDFGIKYGVIKEKKGKKVTAVYLFLLFFLFSTISFEFPGSGLFLAQPALIQVWKGRRKKKDLVYFRELEISHDFYISVAIRAEKAGDMNKITMQCRGEGEKSVSFQSM